MSKELSIYNNVQDPITAFKEMGKAFAESKLFGIQNEAQGVILAMACFSERKSPIEIMREHRIVFGQLTMKADAMLANFKRLGGKCIVQEATATRAAARFIYDGNDFEAEYTIEQAKTEQLAGSTQYKIRPADMLWARLVSKTIRKVAPEVIFGVYTPEEAETFFVQAETAPEPKLAKPATPAVAEEPKIETFKDELPEGTIEALEAAFEDLEPFASAEFERRGWIKANRNFRDVSAKNAAIALKPSNLEKLKARIAEMAKAESVIKDADEASATEVEAQQPEA